jgi:hypothetical protein
MDGHNLVKINGAKKSALKKELVLTAEELEAAKAAGQDIKKIVEERHNALDFAAERQVLQNKIAALERGGPTQLRIELDNILKKNGINAAFEPLVELALERYPKDFSVANLAGQLVCSVDQRIKIWTELLSYQLPKLKAIEVAGQVDHSLTVVIRRFGGDTLLERNVTPQAATEVPVTVVPDEKLDNNKKKPNKREQNRKAAEETANAAVKIKKF